jgi:hypothetical protein
MHQNVKRACPNTYLSELLFMRAPTIRMWMLSVLLALLVESSRCCLWGVALYAAVFLYALSMAFFLPVKSKKFTNYKFRSTVLNFYLYMLHVACRFSLKAQGKILSPAHRPPASSMELPAASVPTVSPSWYTSDRSEADDSPRLLVEREGHAEVGAEAREGRQRAAEESEGSVGAEDGRRAAERRGEKRPPRLRVARAH